MTEEKRTNYNMICPASGFPGAVAGFLKKSEQVVQRCQMCAFQWIGLEESPLPSHSVVDILALLEDCQIP